LKHRQERENKLTAGTFTKDEDYLVIKQDPAYCWKFIGSRDCRRMSQAESQVLSGEYGISCLGDSVEVFRTVEDGDGVDVIIPS
jgi:hypothetical protein